MRKLLEILLLIPVRLYQYIISPLTPASCRHYPTCSEYAYEAIRHHGPYKGFVLATDRFFRCHPWGTHGIDPVPKIIVKKLKIKGPACDRLKH